MTIINPNWRKTFKSLGPVNFFVYGLHRLLQLISARLRLTKYYVVAQPIKTAPLLTGSRGRNITVRLISRYEPMLESLDPRSRPAGEFEKRFDKGGVVFAAFKDDMLVGYLWFVFDSYQENFDRCLFVLDSAKPLAWDVDLFILPSERVGFVFVKLWDEANKYLRERGIQWTLSRVAATNSDSINAHKRLGMRHIGHLVFFTLGRVQITFSTLHPRVHCSIHNESLPTYKVGYSQT